MKIAVTGATGFVGRHLVERLLRENHEITILSHSHHGEELFGKQVRVVRGSVEDRSALEQLCSGNHAVFHLVGIIAETKAKTFDKTVTEATRQLVDTCQRQKVSKIVYLSAMGTSAHSRTKYHQSKYQAEQAVILSGLDCVIFRPSIIYGPGDGFVNTFVRLIRWSPFIPVIGSGKYRLQPIFIDDLTEALAHCLILPEASGEIIELGGPEKLEFLQILHIIKRILNKRRVNIRLPLLLMNSVAFIMEKLLNPAPLTRDQISMLLEENVGDIKEMKRIFHIEPVKLEDGLRKYMR